MIATDIWWPLASGWLANLRANCERYDWARAERERVVAAADPWVKLSDDELWHMIPG
ncbi:MAG: hypothetical protein HPY69_21585, partial [Armatimonadetes bacterium]|nr:hypothetical protein [Armatimonadota bacterium]